LFFLPSVLYALLAGNAVAAYKNPFLLLSGLVVGLTGFFGTIHHFTRHALNAGKGNGIKGRGVSP